MSDWSSHVPAVCGNLPTTKTRRKQFIFSLVERAKISCISSMKSNSKALLDFEGESTSSLESKLLFHKSETAKCNLTDEKNPTFSPIHQSQFIGKVRDFLGVISEANKKLELDVKTDPEKYDLEALTGEESQCIEMDLMLGVAELQTEEAVAAAESALAGYQPVVPLASSSDDDDSDDVDDDDDSDDVDDDDEAEAHFPNKGKTSKPGERDSSREASRKKNSRKRPKIVELS